MTAQTPEPRSRPEPFTHGVVRCPGCGHGIDPHVAWGDPCGVGGLGGHRCQCRWTPNDIAAENIADATTEAETRAADLRVELDAERAKVARVEALHYTSDDYWCEQDGFSWPCPTVRALGGDPS